MLTSSNVIKLKLVILLLRSLIYIYDHHYIFIKRSARGILQMFTLRTTRVVVVVVVGGGGGGGDVEEGD